MDQYMALSKKDLQINITLNELYNTHSLLLQHIDTLVCVRLCYKRLLADPSMHSHQMRSNTSVS